jgi:tetratricopeptide (TPR) repeat protein
MSEINLNPQGDVNIGGNVIGRDSHITNITQEAPVPAALSLHQLPAPPADFTGREAELEELRAALKTGGVTISGLHGLGGVGKTALALKLANELVPLYPDAQFYINLRGTEPDPLTPAQAYAHIIRAYYPESKLPDDEAQLRTLYHSVLAGQRALLLLDNARDAAQVAPLLPPPGSLALLTSRQTFAVPGLRRFALEALKPEDAEALIFRIAERLESGGAGVKVSVTRIAALCGYLPLALRAAASFLAENVDADAETYARDLESEAARLELAGLKAEGVPISVRASFNLSYHYLPSEAQRVFRGLAVFPSDFDSKAEETICDDKNHQQLSLLLRWNLVVYDNSTKRYWLHDLVRIYASEQIASIELFNTSSRFAAFYGELLFNLNVLYRDQPKQQLVALTMFDLEVENFWSGHRWLSSNLSNHPSAPELLNKYSDEPYVLDSRLKPNERVYWIGESLKASRLGKNRLFECVHLGNLGLAHRDKGELNLALNVFKAQFVIANEINKVDLKLNAQINTAMIYDEQGMPREAIKIYEDCLPERRRIKNQSKLAVLLNNLGNSYSKIGDKEQSKRYLDEAFEIRKISGDLAGIFSSILNSGVNLLENGHYRIASEKFDDALQIAKKLGDKNREAYALINIALCQKALGEFEFAFKNAKLALSLAEQEQRYQLAEQIRRQLAEWKTD